MMRVFEFGEVPPPFGGVTVHVRRLIQRLMSDGFDVTWVARRQAKDMGDALPFLRWPTLPRYLNHLEFLWSIRRPFGDGILHIHGNPVFFSPVVWLHVRRGGNALITVHDQMLDQRLARALPHERRCFSQVSQSPAVWWIAVSDSVREILSQSGVSANRIRVIPAYLAAEGADAGAGLPEELATFLQAHTPTMIVYGYKRVFLDGHDLYGFDFALDVLHEVLREAPRAGLVLLCPAAQDDAEQWSALVDAARARNLSAHVLFHLRPVSDPLTLWKHCDVMLRPTLTDGDSVAIREAIALGRMIIASDVAPRPAAVRTLPLGSAQAWARAVLESIGAAGAPPEGAVTAPDGYTHIKSLLSLIAADAS